MNVAFVTNNYPTPSLPGAGTFVQQFVWALARQGSDCSVIHPTSVFDRRYGRYPPYRSMEGAGSESLVEVLRPLHVTFSSRSLGWTNTGRWTQRSVSLAARRAVARLTQRPDVVYGHFLYHAGKAAVVTAQRLGVPSVVGVGEGTFWTVDAFGYDRARRDFENVSGFLAVASHIREGLVSRLGVPPERIIVEPNGVDRSRFFQMDRAQARAELGLPASLFIAVFVGTFDDLKGGSELVAAVGDLEDLGIVMIGRGEKVFRSRNMVFTGGVPHDQMPRWLNAADVFVLPTREEGSCNAVIEAIACGVPVVTSNGQYMDDIVDDSLAIRVDPTDVKAIRQAVLTLRFDAAKRSAMSSACLKAAERFDINDRARRVRSWMEDLVRNHRP